MLQFLLVTAPLSAVCSRLLAGIPLSADSRHSERLASQANFATFDRRRRGAGDLRASLTEHRVVDDRVGTFLVFWNTQRRGLRWRCRSCENLKGAAKFMVRLAGVEPATLGLEVLRAAHPVRLTFHPLRSETAHSPECVEVRGIARRRVSLVTVSVTAEQLPLSGDAAESKAALWRRAPQNSVKSDGELGVGWAARLASTPPCTSRCRRTAWSSRSAGHEPEDP